MRHGVSPRAMPQPCGVGDPMHVQKLTARESGEPTGWPRSLAPRSAPGTPRGHAGDVRSWAVGQAHSTVDAVEQRCGCRHARGGGRGKGSGQGELVSRSQARTQSRICLVTCVLSSHGLYPREARHRLVFRCSSVRPEAGAVCVSSARTDLRGGRRVTGVPTATKAPIKIGGKQRVKVPT